MEFRHLTPEHAVSPQIAPEDMPAICAAGFTTVICNRPDSEVPAGLRAADIRAAAEAAGLDFVEIPFAHGDLSSQMVRAQADALAAAAGPVLAYCASGNRCSILWALSQTGERPVDEILAATLRAGYDQSRLRPNLEALAARET